MYTGAESLHHTQIKHSNAILKPVDYMKRKYSCNLWLIGDITSTFVSACVHDMNEVIWALLLSEKLWDGHGLVRCPREMTNETVTDSIVVRW